MRKHTRTPFSNQRKFIPKDRRVALGQIHPVDHYSVTSQDITSSESGGDPNNPPSGDGGTGNLEDRLPLISSVSVTPQSISVNEPSPTAITLTVVATVKNIEASGLTYQWQKQESGTSTWTNISGQTNTTYDVPAGLTVAADEGDKFRCSVEHPDAITSPITSNEVVVDASRVIAITTQPSSAGIVPQGTTETLTAVATISSDTLSYKWQSRPEGITTWTDITGANGTGIASGASVSYTTPSLVVDNNGDQYRVIFSNSEASDSISQVVTLTVGGADFRVQPTINNIEFWSLEDNGPLIFEPTGINAISYTITSLEPNRSKYIAKMWGQGSCSSQGGHSYGEIPVSGADQFTVQLNAGGGAGNSNQDGGGYAGIFDGTVSHANALMIAGGAGAGGDNGTNDCGNAGGAGGGTTGGDGTDADASVLKGSGGSQSAGGSGGISGAGGGSGTVPTNNTYGPGTRSVTVPANVFSMDVVALGGGAGGGGGQSEAYSSNGDSGGGGGGGGGCGYSQNVSVTPGEILYVRVGSGGSGGGHRNTGVNGGSSFIRRGSSSGTIIVAGYGGSAGSTYRSGGGSGGYVGNSGGSGGAGNNGSASRERGGGGGGAGGPFGAGGQGGAGSTSGQNGTSSGAGGGGGGTNESNGEDGGGGGGGQSVTGILNGTTTSSTSGSGGSPTNGGGGAGPGAPSGGNHSGRDGGTGALGGGGGGASLDSASSSGSGARGGNGGDGFAGIRFYEITGTDGSDGSALQGGAGGTSGIGGGGGGGYYGGGGGSAGATVSAGGGGGSGYVDSTLTNAATSAFAASSDADRGTAGDADGPSRVVINDTYIVISQQPSGTIASLGDTPSLSVTATINDAPSATVNYQWQKKNSGTFTNISGATSSSYTIPPLTSSDAGSVFRCVVGSDFTANKNSDEAVILISAGGSQTYTLTTPGETTIPIPSGASEFSFWLWGAGGQGQGECPSGSFSGGSGGFVTSTISNLDSADTLTVFVGASGQGSPQGQAGYGAGRGGQRSELLYSRSGGSANFYVGGGGGAGQNGNGGGGGSNGGGSGGTGPNTGQVSGTSGRSGGGAGGGTGSGQGNRGGGGGSGWSGGAGGGGGSGNCTGGGGGGGSGNTVISNISSDITGTTYTSGSTGSGAVAPQNSISQYVSGHGGASQDGLAVISLTVLGSLEMTGVNTNTITDITSLSTTTTLTEPVYLVPNDIDYNITVRLRGGSPSGTGGYVQATVRLVAGNTYRLNYDSRIAAMYYGTGTQNNNCILLAAEGGRAGNGVSGGNAGYPSGSYGQNKNNSGGGGGGTTSGYRSGSGGPGGAGGGDGAQLSSTPGGGGGFFTAGAGASDVDGSGGNGGMGYWGGGGGGSGWDYGSQYGGQFGGGGGGGSSYFGGLPSPSVNSNSPYEVTVSNATYGPEGGGVQVQIISVAEA